MAGSEALERARASGFVVVGGARLELRWIGVEPGDAPTIVFLHEGLGSAGMWRDFPERLVERLGMGGLVFSRRGYGRSDPVEVPRPLDYMEREGSEVLPELFDVLGIEDAILFGHSDGGSIAIVAAASVRLRDRVRALVLEAPHVFCEDVSVASIARARDAFEHGDLRARLARHHGDNVDGAFWGWNRAWLDPRFRDWNIERYAADVRAPMLLVQGEADEYGTLAQLDAIARASGGRVERLVLAGAGHAPHRDAADTVLDATARFIGSAS